MAKILKTALGAQNVPRLKIRALSTSATRNASDFRVSRAVMEEFESEDLGNQENKKRKLISVFKSVTNFKSKQQLEKLLCQSILYYNPDDKNGLVGINKPYGLPVHPSKDTEFNLVSCIPAIANHLELDHLELIKSTERYTSGITLLASSKDALEKIQKTKIRVRKERLLNDSYLTLVSGHTKMDSLEDFCLTLKEFPELENPLFSKVAKEPIIKSVTRSHWARMNKKERLQHAHVASIQKSSKVPMTLVNISPSTTKNHLIRVYLAHKGFPVLGDNLYSYRVKTILGKKVNWSNVAVSQTNKNQILPSSMLELFGMDKSDVWRIPACIHHWRCVLPGWTSKKKDVTIFAPPPHYFQKILEEADIKFSFEDLMEVDRPTKFMAKEKPKKENAVKDFLKKNIVDDNGDEIIEAN
eukprot:TRINITY_DN11572_c0_g1_i2.p2 TRINITY_DN11572_c0_g1~~TRINITY_DN11572_c0_g1_i2.p2  ORF type:complete len:413 (-),score=57.59 TRINITY_DN11572_c0_g1_i2:265-1503(-)